MVAGHVIPSQHDAEEELRRPLGRVLDAPTPAMRARAERAALLEALDLLGVPAPPPPEWPTPPDSELAALLEQAQTATRLRIGGGHEATAEALAYRVLAEEALARLAAAPTPADTTRVDGYAVPVDVQAPGEDG